MKKLILLLALLFTTPAFAAFDTTDPRPGLAAMRALIENGKPGDAVTPLYDWVVATPEDADALNLLGYALRKLERYDEARKYYTQALKYAPAHLGALEYMGELELETGNPDAAKALLIRLKAACPDGCHELDDLLEAFETHEVSPDF